MKPWRGKVASTIGSSGALPAAWWRRAGLAATAAALARQPRARLAVRSGLAPSTLPVLAAAIALRGGLCRLRFRVRQRHGRWATLRLILARSRLLQGLLRRQGALLRIILRIILRIMRLVVAIGRQRAPPQRRLRGKRNSQWQA